MPNELPGAGLGSSGSGGSSGVNGANGDFMSIIGALKTEEMIALACGGAGFLLFIVVIIVIIIRFKKKQQKKKKKSQGLYHSIDFWQKRSFFYENQSFCSPIGCFHSHLESEKYFSDISKC